MFATAAPARSPTGLVAAYGFNEGSGTRGDGPVGHGQQRHDLGDHVERGRRRFGGALSFNGTNALGDGPRQHLARPDDRA